MTKPNELFISETNLTINDESISVSDLNRLAKTLLENNMPIFWIKGEISGIRRYSHIYFDLKDESAKISCVIFAGVLNQIDFNLENGTQIEVRGKITIYPQNGSYQINVERVRRVGLGALWEAYNRLLSKLKAEGLFDQLHKKKLPVFPNVVGVITSKEGAVIRDVVTTLKRRMPNLQIIVYHSLVQGSDASMQLSKAIRTANQRNEVDVLIICRGGGSMEDLWCFNEEVLVREVFTSHIPIISAVGHETDTTLIDFVSDLRAPTPTAAAEIVIQSRNEWLSIVDRLEDRLLSGFNYIIDSKKQAVDLYLTELKYLNPIARLKQQVLLVDGYKQKIESLLKRVLTNKFMKMTYLFNKFDTRFLGFNESHERLSRVVISFEKVFDRLLLTKKTKLDNLTRQLDLLNPTTILSRGYAIVKNKNGQIVQSSDDVIHHERVELILKNDHLSAIIDKKHNSHQSELI